MSDAVHQQFLNRLDKSHAAVVAVASWLTTRGNTVTISSTQRAPTVKEWEDYADGGDLFLNQRIEVKCISQDFTCADDWKFGSKFIVCGKNSYDRANPKPYAYVCVNKNLTHAGIVFVRETKENWWVETKEDRNYPNPQTFYVMPTNLVKFVEIKK